jgi:hypothetical protein
VSLAPSPSRSGIDAYLMEQDGIYAAAPAGAKIADTLACARIPLLVLGRPSRATVADMARSSFRLSSACGTPGGHSSPRQPLPDLSAALRNAGVLAQLGGSLIVAGAGMALPGPRRQYEQQSRVGKRSHGVALSGLEHGGKPRPSDRAGDVDLTGDDHDVSALMDLMVL